MTGRRRFEDYLRLQRRQIYTLFHELAEDLGRALARAEREGKVPIAAAAKLRAQITELVGLPKLQAGEVYGKIPPGLFKDLSATLGHAVAGTVDYALKSAILTMDAAGIAQRTIKIGTSFIGHDGAVRRFNAARQAFLKSTWAKVNRSAVTAVKAWRPGGLAFSERVWEITYQSQKELLGMVQQGLVQGKSAARISRDVRQYLALPDTFRGQVLKDYHPGQGVYKSAYKNAMRLTRTELNRAFAEGTYRYGMSKKWIDGWIWRIGNIDACDLCRQYNGKFFAKAGGPPDIPAHPQCMCIPELHIEGDPYD